MASATSLPTYGLAKIEVADILPNGGIGTSFSTMGYTYEGTCKLVEADPEVTTFNAEEIDTPVIEIYKGGKVSLNFSIMDPIPSTMETLMGGTASGSMPNRVWTAPESKTQIYKSVKITPVEGYVITIPRAAITAKINAELSKKNIVLLDVIATVMPPSLAGTPPITFTEQAE